jgi:hypothetical protein
MIGESGGLLTAAQSRQMVARTAQSVSSWAAGTGAPRVYVVEPTGPFENDPNVTDKKSPGKRRSALQITLDARPHRWRRAV